MSNKDQKKKGGQDTGKKRGRMRESVEARKQERRRPKNKRDEVDTVKFKPGSASDRSRRGAP
jgi:hypothetical protein